MSSKFIGPCRLCPPLRRPPLAWLPAEFPSAGSLEITNHGQLLLRWILIVKSHLLVLAKPPRLPVIIGPKISFAILKYGVLLFPDVNWNGPPKSLKTPRIVKSSWSSESWWGLLLLLSGTSSMNPPRHWGHTNSYKQEIHWASKNRPKSQKNQPDPVPVWSYLNSYGRRSFCPDVSRQHLLATTLIELYFSIYNLGFIFFSAIDSLHTPRVSDGKVERYFFR